MKAEITIDHQELVKEVTQAVIKALKPLLKDNGEDSALFTVKGLARHLQVSEKWVYERVQFKEIPFYKVGANLRFKRSAVDRWLEDTCMTPPVPKEPSGPLKMLK
jgi:excisionase family DNA binding protein